MVLDVINHFLMAIILGSENTLIREGGDRA